MKPPGEKGMYRTAERVKRGELLPAREHLCWDCEERAAHVWDHTEGYEDHQLDIVEPVCQRCHTARHKLRKWEPAWTRYPNTRTLVASLPATKRKTIERIGVLMDKREDARDAVGAQIQACLDDGITFSMMGEVLGISRQAVHNAYRTWKDRQT